MDIAPYRSLLEKFFGEVAILQHYQRLSANIAKQTIRDLQERDNGLANFEAETREILGSSVNLFSFYNPYTGIIHPYSHNKLNLKETAKLVHLHKNKQYQWLLVEAYEFFEDFVVSLYELTRGESADFRLSKDLDATFPRDELKKKVPQIIDLFRKKLPELAKIEVKNETNTNLRLHICMAEKFRHIIVHKNGKTIDPESMIDDILKRSNLASDKTKRPAAKAVISNYVQIDDAAGLIMLVELPVFNHGGLAMDINRHENMVNSLLAHAMVMSQSLFNHFGRAQQVAGRP